MFKSFSDSIRSLWQFKPSERAGKRKRPPDDVDLDDSDVEIVSVKKPRKDSANSTFGLLSFLTTPVNRMSEWVRRQRGEEEDHVCVPPSTDRSRRTRGVADPLGERQRQFHDRISPHTPATNGSFTSLQNGERLSRLPLHSQNGAHENGVNGDVDLADPQPSVITVSSSSSRHSSTSSVRPGRPRLSTVHQCIQLKEKEEYRKLLQQYTSVDLGYSVDTTHRKGGQGTHAHNCRNQRKSRLPAQTSASLSPSSSSLHCDNDVSRKEDLPASARLQGPSGHLAVCPQLPWECLGQEPRSVTTLSTLSAVSTVSSVSNGERLMSVGDRLRAHRPLGRGHRGHATPSPTPPPHRAPRGKRATGRTPETPTAASDPDPDVIFVEDSASSSTSRQSPSLNFLSSEYLDEDWIDRLNSKYASAEKEMQRLIEEAEKKKQLLEERREGRLGNLDKRLRQQMRLFDEEVEVIEDLPLPDAHHKPLPELTDDMQRVIDNALSSGPQSQVLCQGFRLQLTRADIHTLRGLNWLNDEVINFYMNLLMERGEKEGYSKTYAFNTFFYPKLISGGHDAVKRWTRKVDVFAHRYLIIPVHLGVHWCLCVVFMEEKTIRYYDSMGGNNNQCLNAVRQYLYDESRQKRSVQLDLSEWSAETVKDIPQQMNGSDCGMFSCMYAETLTRGAPITFTQEDMPYFRRRMVYELVKKTLL